MSDKEMGLAARAATLAALVAERATTDELRYQLVRANNLKEMAEEDRDVHLAAVMELGPMCADLMNQVEARTRDAKMWRKRYNDEADAAQQGDARHDDHVRVLQDELLHKGRLSISRRDALRAVRNVVEAELKQNPT